MIGPDEPIDDLDEDLSIRAEYERLGPAEYYRRHGRDYRNPHEHAITRGLKTAVERWKPDLTHVLDLAAGSGEVTLALRAAGAAKVDGVDPYTFDAYARRTGQTAERFTFDEVAAGVLIDRRYSLIVCSFALHLCEESRLPRVALQLAMIAPMLWIVTPHKRPRLQSAWGWSDVDEFVVERVRLRCHASTMCV